MRSLVHKGDQALALLLASACYLLLARALAVPCSINGSDARPRGSLQNSLDGFFHKLCPRLVDGLRVVVQAGQTPDSWVFGVQRGATLRVELADATQAGGPEGEDVAGVDAEDFAGKDHLASGGTRWPLQQRPLG